MVSIIDLGAEETDFLITAVENLSEKFKITTDETEIIKSDRIILPASGDTANALRNLHILNLYTVLRICKKPLLGICLGMHLMGDYSADGNVSCLGIIPVNAERFETPLNKRPFRGNHSISLKKKSPLFKDISDGESFYFCNSYYIPVNEHTTAIADNNMKFSASLQKDNFYGVQFSPQKSGEAGLKIIQNFIELPLHEQ
jgi:imidazole glycerol-phosphate synthase subunit HisH